MQGNGNGYTPYDPFAQERRAGEYADQSVQMPQQQMPRQTVRQECFHQPQRQQKQKPQTERAPQIELDVAPCGTYATPSHDRIFVMGNSKVKTAVIAGVMTLVIACGGFVIGRIRAEKAEKATAQNDQQNTFLADVEPSPEIVKEDAANVIAVELNTTTPQFGTARLQITFTVDADAVVRVEILKADGSVFCVVEDALEVSEGKLRTFFDGKDVQGNWIPVGSYQVRVTSLIAPADTDPDMESTDIIDWEADNSKSVDFTVGADARPTQNSRPAAIATPTPSPSPSPSQTPDVRPSPSNSATTPTPTPGNSQTATPTPDNSQTATPTPEAPTPTPEAPVSTPDVGADTPPID